MDTPVPGTPRPLLRLQGLVVPLGAAAGDRALGAVGGVAPRTRPAAERGR